MAVTITQDDVKRAKSYMPLAYKQAISGLMAKLCVREVENGASTEENPLPSFRVEDRMMRQQCLMGVLAQFYFGMEFENAMLEIENEKGETRLEPIKGCMTVAEVDKFCESHPINQLERLKREKAVANKVYDILYDFKGFEAFLNGAIREELEMQNDPSLRMAQMMALASTPQRLKETLDVIASYKEETGGTEDAG